MKTTEMTVRDIMQRAKGPKGLYAKLLEAGYDQADGDPVIKESAVYKWRDNGIPERHWPIVQKVCCVTAEQLHLANEALRQSRVEQAA
jgi:hypothetical protein